LVPSSALQPAAAQTVHVGTDTSSGSTVYYYNQADIAINAGDTVTWLLDGTEDHTVTSDDGLFDSGSLQHDFLNRHPDGSFSWEFDNPGVYHYHCQIHSAFFGGAWHTQTGSVTVLAVPEPASTTAFAICAGALLRRRRRS
jgi:plastocyanin